jgi:hypothetical protein
MERAAGLAHDDNPEARLGKLDTMLARTSTSIEDAAPEMLSLPNEGLFPALTLAPQQRRAKIGVASLVTVAEERKGGSPRFVPRREWLPARPILSRKA